MSASDTLVPVPTTPESHEPFVATYELAASVGNSEMKALTLILLAQQNAYLNRGPMGTMLRKALEQGGSEWIPGSGQAFSYCRQTFEPIGQVVKGTVESNRGMSDAYKVSDDGYEVGVPFAGLILDWSLKYPDLSVQTIFGATNSSGDSRSAQRRAEVLFELATHPKSDKGLSISDISQHERKDSHTKAYKTDLGALINAVERLEDAGIVTVDRSLEANDRQFEIVNATRSETDSVTAPIVTHAVYEFIQSLTDQDQTTFSFDECLSWITERIRQQHPDYDAAQIRNELSYKIAWHSPEHSSGNVRQPIPGLVQLSTFNEGGHTRVKLNPAVQQPITELMGILMAVEDRDPEMLAHGRRRADKIAASPEDVGAIGTKAYRFSPYAKKRPMQQTAEQVREILAGTGGPLDVSQITDALRAEGRQLTPASTKLILQTLVDSGGVVVSRGRSRDNTLQERNYYQISDQSQN